MTVGLSPEQRKKVAAEVDALYKKHESEALRLWNDLREERCCIVLKSTQGRSITIRGAKWSEQ